MARRLLGLLLSSLLLACKAVVGIALPSNLSHTQNRGHTNIAELIMAKDPSSFSSHFEGNLVRGNNRDYNSWGVFPPAHWTPPRRSEWNCTKTPIYTNGDRDYGDLGVFITNADTVKKQAFFVYHNLCDYIPYKYIWVEANATEFVSVPLGFEGRIVRGNEEVTKPLYLGTSLPSRLADHQFITSGI